MKIRAATKYDLQGVHQCFKRLNVEFVDYFSRKRVKWLLKNYCIAVVTLENSNEIVGACAVRDNYDDTLEVFAIATLYTGCGIGRKLMKWAEAMSIACDREIIYAESYGFYNASPFYEKLGYTRQGENIYTFFKYLDFPVGHQYTIKYD